MGKCFIHKWKGGCKCLRCGATRDKAHQWNQVFIHNRWGASKVSGCKCQRCGLVIKSAPHNWDYSCVCVECGEVNPHFTSYHDNGLCVCGRCGKPVLLHETKDINEKYARKVHKGPFEQDPENPCIIICRSCGKRIWEHDFEEVSSHRMSNGWESNQACKKCGYRFIPREVGYMMSGKLNNCKNGYVDE